MDKREIIRLRDIYSKEYSTGKYIKLSKHGYYLSLVKNDRKIFENFVKHSEHQMGKKSSKWEYFLGIEKNIQENGFDFSVKDKITIIKKDGKSIGQCGKHRLCILLKMYGKDLKLEIKDRKLVAFHL